MGLGYVEGITYDFIHHGITTLFAALDIETSQIISNCKIQHSRQKYLQFLKQVDTNVPSEMRLHLIVDYYPTHKCAQVKRWLASRPRF